MLTPARILGLALLAVLWIIGLRYAIGSMTVHMLVHLGVVALAPALLAPRLPFRAGPVLLGIAVVAEMVVVWSWHLPAPHAFARLNHFGFAVEQLCFLGAGLLLWAAVRSAGPLGGSVVLLGTVMHMTLLGALIGLADRPIYGVVCTGTFGFDTLQDQQVAGALMATGGLLYLFAALARLAPALKLEGSPTR